MTTFLQLIVVGLSTGSVFAVVGMSLVLIYRTTGIVNFAQGIFAVLGALLTFQFTTTAALARGARLVLSRRWPVDPRGRRLRLQPAHDGLASLIITLGASFLAEALLLLAFGDIPRSYPGISDHAWNIGGVLVQPQYVLIAAVALLAAVGLTLFLRRTIVGQALVACSDSRRAAELVGLNIRSIAVVAFVGAGLLGARRGAARTELPDDLRVGRHDHRQRLRRRRLRRSRLDPARVDRRLCARHPRAARRRLHRLAVQPRDRARGHARPHRLALPARDRGRSHVGLAAVPRARAGPAAVSIALSRGGGVFACWLPFQLSTFDLGLYDRMGLYTLVTIGLTLLTGFAGQISLGQGAFFLIGAYTSAVLTVGIDPATRFVDPDAGIEPLLAVLAAPVLTGIVAPPSACRSSGCAATTSHSRPSRSA